MSHATAVKTVSRRLTDLTLWQTTGSGSEISRLRHVGHQQVIADGFIQPFRIPFAAQPRRSSGRSALELNDGSVRHQCRAMLRFTPRPSPDAPGVQSIPCCFIRYARFYYMVDDNHRVDGTC
jgi:hypothetical protein